MSTYYQVFITPKTNVYSYGTEIDVSDYIDMKGISTIQASIDATDFDMGAFKFSDLTLKGINRNGYFNDAWDKRSIFFPYTRDLAKVRVVFTNSDGDTIVFRGLINEEATKADFKNDTISFRVLSLDSCLRNTKVSGGTISNGMSCSNAIKTILNVPSITAVLNYNASYINPDYNFTIDVGSAFDNLSTKDALNLLLVASNSVMTIDSSLNMIVKTRDTNSNSILNIYGPYDIYGRQNALDLKDVNSGKQRMFNSFLINSTEENNAGSIVQYGFKQKAITMDFVTSPTTEQAIAANLVDEFKYPKMELQIDVPTYLVRNSILLDPVSVNWPLRVTPVDGKFLPIVGDTKIGDTTAPLPNEYGSLSIDPGISFKIIELKHNPSTFVTTLKLRQSGKDFADGYFRYPASSIIGFAIIGDGIIGSGTESTPLGNFVGQAVIGTHVIG